MMRNKSKEDYYSRYLKKYWSEMTEYEKDLDCMYTKKNGDNGGQFGISHNAFTGTGEF